MSGRLLVVGGKTRVSFQIHYSLSIAPIKTSVNRLSYIFLFSLQDCLRHEYISTKTLLAYTGPSCYYGYISGDKS